MAGTVTFRETDASGNYHYSNALIWGENAEHALLRAIGAAHLIERLPRRAVAAEFHRPLKAGDRYEVDLTIERIGRSSISYRWRVLQAGDLMANGSATVVHVDHGGKSSPIPDDIRARVMQMIVSSGS
ncbi:acyl-CoA thioesterase [Sphingobium lactosutens]|uniref:Uncharacterized protein n=1 Tax=Sphingobium lactosutens DS20 TaxID=1331060 RepID=T0HMK4_9SPHN|nr:thioesterase family protein [Sphingobium lactosutens]EQB13398.1 hypothetical protein RLDS_16830 [Sphingobium lactosutens DS20]